MTIWRTRQTVLERNHYCIPQKKHNADTMRGFSIEIYIGGPPYESYFIALTLQEQIIIGLTKKLVVTYIVGDLVLLDQFMRT